MMKLSKWTAQAFFAVSALNLSAALCASELPQHFQLKSEHVALPMSKSRFPAGPGAELANSYCLMCHSAGMVYRQPPLSMKDWKVEVAKMRKVFGCPLPANKVELLAAYMYRLNGAKATAEPSATPPPAQGLKQGH